MGPPVADVRARMGVAQKKLLELQTLLTRPQARKFYLDRLLKLAGQPFAAAEPILEKAKLGDSPLFETLEIESLRQFFESPQSAPFPLVAVVEAELRSAKKNYDREKIALENIEATLSEMVGVTLGEDPREANNEVMKKIQKMWRGEEPAKPPAP